MCLYPKVLPCGNTLCLVLGNKTYALPREIASYMINFTKVNGFQYKQLRGNSLSVGGYTLQIGNYEFVITRKGVVLCVPFNEMLRVIEMMKKMGVEHFSAYEDPSFKQRAKKAVFGGLEQFGFKKSSQEKKTEQSRLFKALKGLKEGFVNSPSRPKYTETLTKGLEMFGFKKKKK